jgi:hypothetical protein
MNILGATRKEIRRGKRKYDNKPCQGETHRPEKTDITNKDMTRKRTRIRTMHLASPLTHKQVISGAGNTTREEGRGNGAGVHRDGDRISM